MQHAFQMPPPDAKTVVVSFPFVGSGGSKRFKLVPVEGWERSRKAKDGKTPLWTHLGSTGIWNVSGSVSA